jgi:MerR family redox-sensitive transcriptional activator SoxR
MRHRTDLLTIGETAERSGVAPSALRYYETQGLIRATRTTGNQRRYQRSTLRRVAFIRSAQRVGLSLEEIAEALSTLPDGRGSPRAGGGGSTPRSSGWNGCGIAWTAASAVAASA